ncbi:LysR family transcriptional regulator [Marinomonas sp. S3726]|jgi:DNA-binding transcriptional LysR family regulator|uniref:LysR family transcriptional regulator n=1 Tax=Marinomonas sp. S3726 TaxID=579484 RepID=UPI0005FA7567|nr:LysR family transcriptional regulator [Marinomonas sp. S3726]KJZ14306.1 LysR family transcriptional regulator [Marinomonas sp. S3726]
MNWTLDELTAFVYSVKFGSFSAAARKMGKVQSRISTAIANLEADLGFELFDRSAKLPVLTKDGEQMFIEAQAVLAQCQRLEARAKAVTIGEELTLKVALDEAVPNTAFEVMFQRLADEFPSLKLTIINGSQEDIAQWVEQGIADIGIMFYISTLADSLEFMSIGHFRHSLVVSAQHPLAQFKAPTIHQLAQYRQIIICDRKGQTQEPPLSANHWQIDSYYYISMMVMRGVGWALIPEHVAKSDWVLEELVELSSECIPSPLMVEIGVVNRRDKAIGPVMTWLFEALDSLLAETK